MKIAILSDSHDNVPNIEKFINYVNKNGIEAVIHCGDICAPSIIKKFFGPELSCPVHIIHGNVSDRELLEEVVNEYSHITLHGDFGQLELGGKKIAFVHFPEEAKRLAETDKYDLIFYGHNHRPWDEMIGKARLLNPGTLAGMFQKATFAVYDLATDKAELILVDKIN